MSFTFDKAVLKQSEQLALKLKNADKAISAMENIISHQCVQIALLKTELEKFKTTHAQKLRDIADLREFYGIENKHKTK